MATYVSKLWVDRQSTNPNRRTLTWIDPDTQQEKTLTVTVTREEGTVTVEGDPFAALVMNGLEERISNAFATCDNILVSTNSPTAADGKNNDMFVKYSTSGGSTTITNLYIKISGAWVEVSVGGGGGSSTLAGLTDVNLSSPTDGQALVYDANSSKWVNGAGGSSSASGVYVGTCDTAGDTAVKAVTVSSDQNFTLEKGATIAVLFTNTNSKTNVTLAVNGGTAYGIRYAGNAPYTSSFNVVTGQANVYITYVFDGSYWCWVSYSNYPVYSTMTQAEAEAGTSAGDRVIRPTVLKSAIKYHAPLAVYVGTCSTAGNQAAKSVTISSDQNFVLEVGATICVKFSANNTATNVTLSVNDGTAYSIWYGSSVYSASWNIVNGRNGYYTTYTFDGSYWVWVAHSNYPSYSTMTDAEAEAGTSTNDRLIKPSVLKNAIDYHAPDAVRVDLTQAEYDQLSDAEKNNGMLYFITDADSVYAPVELTQAQYDQLTDDEKYNGSIYFITDAPSNPIDYSTEEKVIGHWVDGKTLYERTFDYNISDMSGGTQSESAIVGRFDLPHVNYDALWIEQSFIMNDSPNSSFTLKSFPIPTIQNNGAYIRTQIQKTDANDGYPFIYIDVQWSISQLYSNKANIHYVYVLRYTKT